MKFSNLSKYGGIAVASFSKVNGIANNLNVKIDKRNNWKIYDSFTDADGTAIASHTPNIGGTWAGGTGNFSISSNKAINSTAAGRIWIESNVADCIINMLYTETSTNSSGGNGIVYRAVDASNLFVGGARATASRVVIYEYTSASLFLRAFTAKTFTASTDYQMTLTLSGNSATIVVGGTSVNYSTAVRNTATLHGFGSLGGGIDSKYDNFII